MKKRTDTAAPETRQAAKIASEAAIVTQTVSKAIITEETGAETRVPGRLL